MGECEYIRNIRKELLLTLERCETLRKELLSFPKGHLSRKRINRKDYFYMQQRIGERVETKFVPYPQVEPLKQKLEERDAKKKLLEELEQFAEKLVKSSKPFGLHLFIEGKNILEDYRMDLLSTEERRRALNEAKAISLCEWSKEELDSTNEIDEKWVNGEITHKEWRERLLKSL